MRPLLQSLFLLCLLGPGPALAADLQVEDPWVRAGPPTARVMAGYMTLHNPGASDREIVRVTSPAFERVELHLSRVEDGMARMIPQDALRIPAHGSLELAPGGYHLMLFNPAAPLQPGDKVELTLQDAAGNRLQVSVPVRLPTDGDAGHSHHHHH
ncbi:copper chaperone PCu(A)C [Thiohalobacter thiocyanaticus]|uniref:Copper chaperone PCu(A)C n=1 Tax=Thiohalobacter thiocyanaticus TaxID=585455 RepID=A0A426QGI3_9GAMM|nr:copper chaperone PCu(A)C [Thiohalobacter thiocyanaticus]RRQ20861.1 copper chaperone PCu(A)C [Thiohalobacter thiocyanaticus]